MKYYIFLDSSNTSLTVALSDQERIIDNISYEAWQTQSEHMIPELSKILEKNNVENSDIKGIVVAVGPGSYTGVRIAITIAKVMSLALNVPIYPISSLQILKSNKKPSICLINARSNRSYIGVYEFDKCLLPDQIMTNEEVIRYINEHPQYIVCGSTSYLKVDGEINDVATQMFSLLPFLKEEKDPRGLKPVYLKD